MSLIDLKQLKDFFESASYLLGGFLSFSWFFPLLDVLGQHAPGFGVLIAILTLVLNLIVTIAYHVMKYRKEVKNESK